MVLDACRVNPFEKRKDFLARSISTSPSSRGLVRVEAARGMLIAYSTAPGAVAEDGDGEHGLYTEVLLRHLPRPGVPVERLFKNVRIDVMDMALLTECRRT